MTGNHEDSTITRCRALVVTGGPAVTGGLAVAGHQAASADSGTATSASASASASASVSTGAACMASMTSVTEGPYYLDGALVRKDVTEGGSGVPLTLRLTVVDATDGCTPVKGAAVEIRHCGPWGLLLGGRPWRRSASAMTTGRTVHRRAALAGEEAQHVRPGASGVPGEVGAATPAGGAALAAFGIGPASTQTHERPGTDVCVPGRSVCVWLRPSGTPSTSRPRPSGGADPPRGFGCRPS